MFYTIAGVIVGGIAFNIIARVTGQSFSSNYGPSNGGFITFLGAILGGAVGLGVGMTKLIEGNY